MWFFQLSWGNILRQRFQSLLLVLGVALGTAVVIAVDLANQSALKGFQLSTQALVGKATHRIEGGPQGVPESIFVQLKQKGYHVALAPVVQAHVYIPELQRSVQLMGVDPLADAQFRNHFPHADNQAFSVLMTANDTVLVSHELAAHIKSEQIKMVYGAAQHTLRIIGQVHFQENFTQEMLKNLVLTDIGTAQKVLGMQGYLSYVDVNLNADTTSLDEQALRALLPTAVTLNKTGEQLGVFQQMTSAFSLNLAALSLLALMVGMFLIYNTISFSVLRRRAQLGTLRALGVDQQEIFTMILFETLILTSLGIILGLGLGVVLGQGLLKLVVRTINDLYFSLEVQKLHFQSSSLIKAVISALSSSLLAALVPAWEATQSAPAGVLKRSALEDKLRRNVKNLSLLGAGLMFIGFIGMQFWVNIYLSFACFFLLVLGAAALVPQSTQILLKGLNVLNSDLLKMGARNIVRTLSRSSVAIAALMVSVSVVVSVNIMIGSFRSSLIDWLDRTLTADIYLTLPYENNASRAGLPRDWLTKIRALPEVQRVESSRSISLQSKEYGSFKLQALSGDLARERKFIWLEQKNQAWQALEDGGVWVSEPFATHHALSAKAGQSVILPTDTGLKSFPVRGIYSDYASDRGTVLLADAVYRKFWQDQWISALGIVTQSTSHEKTIHRQIQNLFGEHPIRVQSNRQLRKGAIEIFDRTFAITGALRLLAVAVAFMGILSTLMALLIERIREFGILRALGFSKAQLAGLILYESFLMGACAGLFALPLGTLLSWYLIHVINLRSFGWSMGFEWSGMFYVQGFALACFAALLAGLYPAWFVTQLKSAEALRYEP